MTDVCVNCGLDLIGATERCACADKLTSIPKKRGAYPNTDKRRAYMRRYMKKRRAGKGK